MYPDPPGKITRTPPGRVTWTPGGTGRISPWGVHQTPLGGTQTPGGYPESYPGGGGTLRNLPWGGQGVPGPPRGVPGPPQGVPIDPWGYLDPPVLCGPGPANPGGIPDPPEKGRYYQTPPLPPCGQTDGWMEGQTLVKTLPSLVDPYAGGKYSYFPYFEQIWK